MGKFKDIAIDLANNAPRYEVAIMQGDGPDDFTWETHAWFTEGEYGKCILCATELHEAGHQIRIFDPFLGKTFEYPKDF